MIAKYEHLETALSVTTVNGTNSYPARFHKDVELVYVTGGYVDVSIDGSSYRLETGDAYAAFPNILHATRQQCSRKYIIMVSPALTPELTETLSHYKPRCPVLRGGSFSPLVASLFERCAQLYQEDPQKHRAVLAAHAGSILRELLLSLELEPRSSDTGLVQQLVEYIQENYTDDITLEQMAQSLRYSKFHISRVISDTFGCNFRTLVNNYRIDMAECLLLNTKKTVSEIAYACGFQNQSSFNRIFLKHCNTTPKQFRAEHAAAPEQE